MRHLNLQSQAAPQEDEEELFLEALMSAHTIAAGMLESALKNLRLEAGTDVTVLSRLEKSSHALRRIELIITRKRKNAGASGSEAA